MGIFPRLSKHRIRSRLSLRILSYILICSAVFSCLSTVIQLYSEYQRDMGRVEESVNQIRKSYLNFLSLSMWHLDKDQLNMQLQGASVLPGIQYLEVREIHENIEKLFYSVGIPKNDRVAHYQYPLVYEYAQKKIHLGNLYITVNLEGVYQRLYDRVALILTTQTIKTFLWAFCVLIIFQHVIMRNLNKIAEYLKKMDLTRLNNPLTLDRIASSSTREDELEHVVMAINTMKKNLMQSMVKQRQVEEELRQSERYKEIQNQIANVFLTIPDEGMYGEVLKVVLQTLNSKFGRFGFIETNGDLVIPSVTNGIWNKCKVSDKSIVFPRNKWGTSLWSRAIREKRFFSSDGPFDLPEGHIPIVHVLTGPVLYRDEVIGIISVANKKNGYTMEDQRLLENIAGYISPILKARLQRDRKEQERRKAEEALQKLNTELDQRVLERTVDLETVNKDLEGFAYSVSHDLRAPLRHIEGFTEILLQKAGPTLDEQGRHYMDTISDSAKKLGRLIDDLLNFSRMGRQAISLQPVDLGKLVDEVIGELKLDAVGRQIKWYVDDLYVVEGDPAMLRLVLVNLISNALKFTRFKQIARIEIGSLSGQNAEAVIFIRDNGVGFDMAYTDKLFGVFQRLHNIDQFEGNGIGLANVRRIIDRHGGRTWAEGKVDNGATFYFSLSKA